MIDMFDIFYFFKKFIPFVDNIYYADIFYFIMYIFVPILFLIMIYMCYLPIKKIALMESNMNTNEEEKKIERKRTILIILLGTIISIAEVIYIFNDNLWGFDYRLPILIRLTIPIIIGTILLLVLIIKPFKHMNSIENRLINDNNEIEKKYRKRRIIISVLGIIISVMVLFFLIFEIYVYESFEKIIGIIGLSISLIVFVILLIFAIKHKFNNKQKIFNVKVALIIQIITIIFLSSAAIWAEMPLNYGYGVNEASAQNSIFKSYFGTNATAQEVKNLFSEIRVNNLTSIRNEELATIGVCFVANNVETDEEHAIYQKSLTEIDSTNITEESFNDYKFISNEESLELIKTNLKSDATYTINIPNKKTWNLDKQENTGFEKDDNPLGATQTGSTGAYYYRRKT